MCTCTISDVDRDDNEPVGSDLSQMRLDTTSKILCFVGPIFGIGSKVLAHGTLFTFELVLA